MTVGELKSDPFAPLAHTAMDEEVLRKLGDDRSNLHDDYVLYTLLGHILNDIRNVDPFHLDTSPLLFLEYRPQLKEQLRRAVAEKHFRRIRLLDYLWSPRVQCSARWLTITFVRHGQSVGNVMGPNVRGADELTPHGIAQVTALGRAFAYTRIDALHCSTLVRARKTAEALSRQHQRRPKPVSQATKWLIERGGQGVPRRVPDGREPNAEAWRHTSPDGYGETYADVAARAVHFLLCLFSYHGAQVSQPPREFLRGTTTDSPSDVPDGIPHVVVVAHNFVLCELFEALLGWNQDEHIATRADFEQASWSRHVLCLRGDERSGVSGRARLYGALHQHIMKRPGEYDPTACDLGERTASAQVAPINAVNCVSPVMPHLVASPA